MRRLYERAGREVPLGSWGHEDDRDLFLIQADGETPVPNHPAQERPPERPHAERRLLGVANRRRQRLHRGPGGPGAGQPGMQWRK